MFEFTTRRNIGLLVAAIAFATPASAQTSAPHAEAAWARATTSSARSGGIFVTLHGGSQPDRLMAAATPVSTVTELHETVAKDGVMQMRPVPALPVPSGGKVELKPGSYHIMLLALTRQLKPGDTFPLTLTFEKAGKVETTVTVGAAGAAGPAGHGMSHNHTMPAAKTP